MTSTVTELTITTITSGSYTDLSNTLGVIVILLLILLLIQKELVRASSSARSPVPGGTRQSGSSGDGTREQMQSLDIAVLPLLLAFAVVILMRFLDIVG